MRRERLGLSCLEMERAFQVAPEPARAYHPGASTGRRILVLGRIGMRNIFARFLLTAALLIFFATVATAEAVPWQIDPAHSAAQFAVRHMMVSTVRGAFSKVSGVVNYDEKNSANSSVEVTVDVSSVDTRVPQRDADLRSGRFFDVT